MSFFQKIFRALSKSPHSLPGGAGWSARMGWRYLTYLEGEQSLSLAIEPMAVGPDIVYVPDAEAWSRVAPAWARNRATEILERIKSVPWSRDLQWSEGPNSAFLTDDSPVSGSLESSSGGQQLEAERLFHPGSGLTHAQAHECWHLAARMFAEATRGRVTLFVNGAVPNSVFREIELPALRSNPHVTLDFR